jgi:hypothetical protein
VASIKSCRCGKFKVDIDVYPEAPSEGIMNCPNCHSSPYVEKCEPIADEKPASAPTQKDIIKLDEVPEGMLRTFTVKMGDVLIGMAKELPNHVIMHVVPADVALAIPLDLAYNLHDGLCTAINILDEGASLELDEDDLPTDPKKWN